MQVVWTVLQFPHRCLFLHIFQVTIFPFVFVGCVGVACLFPHLRATCDPKDTHSSELRFDLQKLRGKCIFVVTLFMWSVFPIVSSTIFQTFAFDERLGDGTAFLKGDYSIQRDDPEHQWYMSYAGIVPTTSPGVAMFVLTLGSLFLHPLELVFNTFFKSQWV